MTEVYFIRHAEPNYKNHDDMTRELTEKGLEDRKLVTEYLLNKNIRYIYSSPYKRAFDTVAHFAETEGIEINIIDDFRERKIDDSWIEDFKLFSKNQWNDFDYKLSAGESLNEVRNRYISALVTLLRKHNGENFVIGSHGAALSAIIKLYSLSFSYDQFENMPMPWIAKFVFEGEEFVSIEYIDVLR